MVNEINPDNDIEAANIRFIKSYKKNCKFLQNLMPRSHELPQKPTAYGLRHGNENVAEFIPTLAEIINLKIEKAEALAQGEDHYDALIDEYEPNISADEISAMFKNLRPTFGRTSKKSNQ